MPLNLPEFPNSLIEGFDAKSPITPKYNCIGWACSNTNLMWPNLRGFFWPKGISNLENINSFIELFNSRGYELCDNGELEAGFLKVAIYTKPDGTPTHAARQLNTGLWTSKLGPYQDIEHTIHQMDGGVYGSVAQYMKKAI